MAGGKFDLWVVVGRTNRVSPTGREAKEGPKRAAGYSTLGVGKFGW